MDWKDGVVVCIPKKGSLADSNNWSGVTLLSTPGKVYCQMMLNRMRDMVDGELRKEQTGFKPKLSCAEQIFTLRRIIENYQEYQLPLATSFTDFTKAFDSTYRTSMWKILITYGITRNIVSAMEKIYDLLRCVDIIRALPSTKAYMDDTQKCDTEHATNAVKQEAAAGGAHRKHWKIENI